MSPEELLLEIFGHPVTETPDLEGGRYDCPICLGRFDSVGDKKRHIRETHPKENP